MHTIVYDARNFFVLGTFEFNRDIREIPENSGIYIMKMGLIVRLLYCEKYDYKKKDKQKLSVSWRQAVRKNMLKYKNMVRKKNCIHLKKFLIAQSRMLELIEINEVELLEEEY